MYNNNRGIERYLYNNNRGIIERYLYNNNRGIERYHYNNDRLDQTRGRLKKTNS